MTPSLLTVLCEAREALGRLVEVSEVATMVGMLGYPENADGPLPRARDMLPKLDAAIARLQREPTVMQLVELQRDAEKYRAINTPEIRDFIVAIEREALHQRERWPSDHDSGKTDADWFWLVGYLAGKALGASKGEAPPRYRHVKRGTTYEVVSVCEDENHRGVELVVYRGEDDGKIWARPASQFFDGRFEDLPRLHPEKLLHHIITTAAACLNWHAHALGAHTKMRAAQPPKETT